MKSDGDRRPRRQSAGVDYGPEHLAVLRALALEWREQWRTEMEREKKTNIHKNHQATNECMTPAARKGGSAQFASAIARREFGKFYCDGKLVEPTKVRKPIKKRS